MVNRVGLEPGNLDWGLKKLDRPEPQRPAEPLDTVAIDAGFSVREKKRSRKSSAPQAGAPAPKAQPAAETANGAAVEPPAIALKTRTDNAPKVLAMFETMAGAGAVPGPGEDGPLLNDKTCLKWDRLGAIMGNRPNYRDVDGVRGMAQPTPEGIRLTLEELKGVGYPDNKVIWTNLREEPLCYIQGKTFTIRNTDHIKQNIEFPGASRDEIQGLEKKFKEEILEKARKGEDIVYYTEDEHGNLGKEVIKASMLAAGDVLTTRDMFDEFARKGYNIDFERVPISDERRPEDSDFDALVGRFREYNEGNYYIVNCQGGTGRSTSAMVVFSLMKQAREKTSSDKPLIKSAAFREELRELAGGDPSEYRPLISMSYLTQKAVNLFLLRGEDMQNFDKVIQEQGSKGSDLLKAIDKYAGKNPEKASHYLERYVYLAVFKQYCEEEGPNKYATSFSEWVKPHKTKADAIVTALKGLCHIPV